MYKDYFEKLNNMKDDLYFIDESDRCLFEEYLVNPSIILMEMANVRGMDVSVQNMLPFSFYFSSKVAVHNQHGIRVKIVWNPSKTYTDADGYMELHGNYNYVSGSHKYIPTRSQIREAENFFKKYKVLFSAVWEGILYEGDLIKFLHGDINLVSLISKFDVDNEDMYYKINHCKSIEDLERCVRENKIFNMND